MCIEKNIDNIRFKIHIGYPWGMDLTFPEKGDILILSFTRLYMQHMLVLIFKIEIIIDFSNLPSCSEVADHWYLWHNNNN